MNTQYAARFQTQPGEKMERHLSPADRLFGQIMECSKIADILPEGTGVRPTTASPGKTFRMPALRKLHNALATTMLLAWSENLGMIESKGPVWRTASNVLFDSIQSLNGSLYNEVIADAADDFTRFCRMDVRRPNSMINEYMAGVMQAKAQQSGRGC